MRGPASTRQEGTQAPPKATGAVSSDHNRTTANRQMSDSCSPRKRHRQRTGADSPAALGSQSWNFRGVMERPIHCFCCVARVLTVVRQKSDPGPVLPSLPLHPAQIVTFPMSRFPAQTHTHCPVTVLLSVRLAAALFLFPAQLCPARRTLPLCPSIPASPARPLRKTVLLARGALPVPQGWVGRVVAIGSRGRSLVFAMPLQRSSELARNHRSLGPIPG